MKKKWEAKDVYTKTFDQRYEEMSKSEKTGYWICVALTCVGIALVFIFGN